MDVEKKGFKYRLSNVLAWVGSFFLITVLVDIAVRLAYDKNMWGWEEDLFTGLALYIGCAVVNYLIVGSLRLLPWRDIE